MALPLSYNLRSLLVRWKSTLLAILGITLVVAVFIGLIAMARGFQIALRSTGFAGNGIAIQRGSDTELTSSIPQEQLDFIAVDARIARNPAGVPLASREMVVIANLTRVDGKPTNVLIRGVSPTTFDVRSGIRLEEGRTFGPGLEEIIVGRRMAERIAHLDLGGTILIQKRQWKVVGIFSAEGSGFESEVWMDVNLLAQVFNRKEVYQSMSFRLRDASELETMAAELARDPKMQVDVKDERLFYEQQAGDIPRNLMILAGFVCTVMGIGAVFAGMNTMYAIVAARTREIGTLRALGFSRGSILVSFLLEAVFLAGIGGALGCLLALPANLLSGATGSATFSEIAFAFRVTPDALGLGIGIAALMGVLGGLLPALQAARMPIASALKET
jgi:putative ABC transport system permease protein